MLSLPRWFLVIALAPLLWVTEAAAQGTSYLKGRLDPFAAGASGDGAAIFSYDSTSGALTWTVTFRNLGSAATGGELHDKNGAAAVALGGTTSPLTGTATITAQQATELLAGQWSVDVHTTGNPSGEIRGNVSVIDTNTYTITDYYEVISCCVGGWLRGVVTFDPASSLMTWNYQAQAPYHTLMGPLGFYGPAVGRESAPQIPNLSGQQGSRTLTTVEAAQLVNGFWEWRWYYYAPPTSYFGAYIRPRYPTLANISTRASVRTGEGVSIAGFVIGGSSGKTVAIVGTGPSLANYAIGQPLADPKITVVRQSDGAVMAINDYWSTRFDNAAGYMPSDVSEAAVTLGLAPGAYTAILESANGGTGVGLVGVYEVNHPENPLVNISTRGYVGSGEDVMIGGFIIQGDGPRTVVITAAGPSLAAYGIGSPLANPTLTLVRQSDGAVIATNDDWGSAPNASDIQAASLAPSDPRESAIMMSLPPGAYTAILGGAGGATGVGLIGVYQR